MSENSPHGTGQKPEGSLRRWFAAVYTLELTIGIGAALGLFLLLLWLLNVALPIGTGFGELVRAPEAARRGDARLGFDAPGGESVAVLVDVRRSVLDRPASSVAWSAARQGTSLRDRHAVQTHDDSGASIRFDQGPLLELGENSVIVVRKPRRVDNSLRRRAAVLFMDGFLRVRLAAEEEGDTDLEIVTAGGTIRAVHDEAQPASISLAVDQRTSALSVLEGVAELVWSDVVTRVPSGHMLTYDADRGPGELKRLPLPPRLVGPSEDARYRYRQAPPLVTFEWRPTGDVRDFRLQIATDPDFHAMVYDERSVESSFVHGNLEAGRYYWRVSGQRGLVSGPSTPARHLTVEQDRQAPALTVELPDAQVRREWILVRGTTEAGCRVLIGEHAVPVDDGGRFEHELALQHGYNFLVVQSIDPTGNTAFRNHTILAELTGPENAP